MASSVLPGAEPWSHAPERGGVDGPVAGALLLHGFGGSPAALRSLAGRFGDAGYHVELPCLPGHGTIVDDMVHTDWNHWVGAVGRALEQLADRADRLVVIGQSMGGALALWTALNAVGPSGVGPRRAELCGLVCINPVVLPQRPDVVAMLHELIDDGMEVVPGGGPDIADPDATDVSYAGTPVRAMLSLLHDGLAPLGHRLAEVAVPLRLFTSRQDHVVDPVNSEHLASVYGGSVEHTWLERSYHVATQDFDRELIASETMAFADRVFADRVTAPAD